MAKPTAVATVGKITDLATHMTQRNVEIIKKQRLKSFEAYREKLVLLKEEFIEAYDKKIPPYYTMKDFILLDTIGQGTFGCVRLCRNKQSAKYYAMKIFSKAQILKMKQITHTLNEKNILNAIRFPFVVNMEFSFKDNSYIYFILPFVQGGDMFTLLRKQKCFKEREAKFFTSQVVLALEYLHFLDLIYRDLKPENILIETNGYIKLTDFGFCKLVKTRTYTLCGTPEYLAPEILASKGYSQAVDWWTVGIFIFELIAGFTPFFSDETGKIYDKIHAGKFKFTADFSREARDLVRNLLQIDLTKRYGNLKDGVNEIKIHDWFKNVEWDMIYECKAEAPFIPKLDAPNDIKYFDNYTDIPLDIADTDQFVDEFVDF